MGKVTDSIMVYGTVWCPDCKRAKRFFGEQRVPYVSIDIERDAEAMAQGTEPKPYCWRLARASAG